MNQISIGLRVVAFLLAIVVTLSPKVDAVMGALILGSFIGIFIWSATGLTFGYFLDSQTQKINTGIMALALVIPMRYFLFDQSSSIVGGIAIGAFIAALIDWRAEKMMKMFDALADHKKYGFRRSGVDSKMKEIERKDKISFRKDERKLIKKVKTGVEMIKKREKKEVENLTKKEFGKFEKRESGRRRVQ